MTESKAKCAPVRLPDGTTITLRDMTTGPLVNATCARCGRLATFIHVAADGTCACDPCMKNGARR